jgi:hypothetical protein
MRSAFTTRARIFGQTLYHLGRLIAGQPDQTGYRFGALMFFAMERK